MLPQPTARWARWGGEGGGRLGSARARALRSMWEEAIRGSADGARFVEWVSALLLRCSEALAIADVDASVESLPPEILPPPGANSDGGEPLRFVGLDATRLLFQLLHVEQVRRAWWAAPRLRPSLSARARAAPRRPTR